MLADATAIRERATRKLGEVMEQRRKAGTLAKPGRRKNWGKKTPNLTDDGIDKNLAKRAREAAALPAPRFNTEDSGAWGGAFG